MNKKYMIGILIIIILIPLLIIGSHYYNKITMPKNKDLSYRDTYINMLHWNSPDGKRKETLLDYIKN